MGHTRSKQLENLAQVIEEMGGSLLPKLVKKQCIIWISTTLIYNVNQVYLSNSIKLAQCTYSDFWGLYCITN